jgi:hypothetical protein
MKTPVKLIVAGLAMMLANLAFASATMKDVETAVDVSKDYRQAETLIKEVVSTNPNDARDHYVYSQILHHNGKHDDAVRELAQAKRLDPAISFVKNPAHVAAYEAELNAEGSHAIIPMTEPIPAQRKSSKTLIWVVLILGVLGVAGYFFYRRTQENDRKEDEARMKLARQEQLKQASALLETVKPFKLDIRMANPANPALLAEVEQVEQELVSLIDRLGQTPVQQSEIDQLSDSLAHLHRKFEGKAEPEPGAQPTYQNTPTSDFSGFSPVGVPAAPVYQQAVPQTVYVENNSGGMGVGGGLLTGMVLGSLMSGSHEREVIHEVREVPVRRNDYDGGQSDIDFGNESTSDSGGDVDFGGSDDN